MNQTYYIKCMYCFYAEQCLSYLSFEDLKMELEFMSFKGALQIQQSLSESCHITFVYRNSSHCDASCICYTYELAFAV